MDFNTTNATVPLSLQRSRLLSLKQLTYLNIIGNLHKFKPNQLALLPINTRYLLMTNIPVSDILKLEHTKVTEDVDMQSVWTTVTSKNLPSEYTEFINSPLFKGFSSMKEFYMEMLATIILNGLCFKQLAPYSGYQTHRELVLDLMFSVRNCLGSAIGWII